MPKRHPLFLCFFFLLVCANAWSQSKTELDTTVAKQISQWHQKADQLLETGDSSALLFEVKALHLVEKQANPEAYIASLHHYGESLLRLGYANRAKTALQKAEKLFPSPAPLSSIYANNQYQLAHTFYLLGQRGGINKAENALALYRQLHDTLGIVKSLSIAGLLYAESGNYNQAAALFMEGLEIHEHSNFTVEKIRMLNNIGLLYFRQDDYTKALKYFTEGLELTQKTPEATNRQLGITYNNLSKTYWSLDQKEEAINYIRKAHNLRKQLQNQLDVTQSYYSMGEIFLKAEQLDSALFYMDTALFRARSMKDPVVTIAALSAKAEIHYFKKEYDQAIHLNEQALALLAEHPNPQDLMISYYNLHWIYYDTKQYETAIDYLDRYYAVRDSLFTAEKVELSEELEVQYETAKKEKTIAQLEKEKLIHEQQQKLTFYRTTGIILTITFICIVLFLLWRAERLKKQRLDIELDKKRQELMTFSLNFIEKKKLINELESHLEQLTKSDQVADSNSLQSIKQLIKTNNKSDEGWKTFKTYFDSLHPTFLQRLKSNYPELTIGELRICAMLKATLSTREIAAILSITPNSVYMATHRIHKKLALPQRNKVVDFLMEF
jgi:tetratricopeptide (TPR) repeat protein/DNA-binding CsgD family transcriptional regulator